MVLVVDERGGADVTSCVRSLTNPLERWASSRAPERAFTFMDYAADREGVARSLTWADLDRRVRAVAATLQRVAVPGERAAILAPNGLEYVVGFLAAIHAGLVAVPLFGPELPGHADRLESVLADCEPACVLTTSATACAVRAFLEVQHGARPREVVLVDAVSDALADEWVSRPADLSDVAYLQYTSGSTRTPAGVVITHRNVVVNANQIADAYQIAADRSTIVVWLPLFHDMGLVLSVAVPLVLGVPSVLMDPMAFVKRPVRWLRMLSEHSGGVTAAPNFAFEYCVRRVKEADRAELRLQRAAVLINGSEPVRPGTIERFAQAFGPCGLDPTVHRPSYGLAEATVFVAASGPAVVPRATWFDTELLAAGTAVPAVGTGGSLLVSCGAPEGQHLAIVDPAQRRRRPDGQVGEIWLHGANVGAGYWNQPEASAATFGARLADGDDLPPGPWLRTGDLGVVHEGELYIVGRIKDLVIIDGRNHYPQDVEATVEAAHPAIRPGYVAAFSVPTDEGEGLVVVAERAHEAGPGLEPRAVAATVRRAVAERHGVTVRDFRFVRVGQVPRTSSGKLARSACRERYLAGELALIGGTA